MRAILLIALLFTSNLLIAQDQLSYKEAVKIALDNNVNLKKVKNQLAVNSALKAQGLAQFGPTFDAFGQGWISNGNTFIQQDGIVINTSSQNLYGQLNANWMLFNGFNNINFLKQSKLAFEAQQTLVQRTEQDIINTVTGNYLQVLLDHELVKIAEENYQNQKTITEQISGFVEVGQRAIVEQYTQEAELKRLETEVLKANRTLRNDKASLGLTLGVDPLSEFTLVDPELDINMVSVNEINLDSLISTAMQNRPDLRSAKQYELSTERGIAVARGSSLPRVSAFAGMSSRWADVQGRNDRTLDQQFFTDNVNKQVGVTLAIPIFSSLRNRTQVVRAKVLRQNAEVDRMFKELQIKSEVYTIYKNFQDYVNSYQVSLAQREAAELALRTQRESYELGIATQVELNEATRRFVEAETNLASNKYRIIFQRILVDYATGVLSFDSLQ